MAGAVQDGGDLLELGDGELGDVAAIELRRDESLQGAELRHRRLPLERHPLVHLRVLTRSTAIIALSFKNPKLKARKKWRVVGEAVLEMQVEPQLFHQTAVITSHPS